METFACVRQCPRMQLQTNHYPLREKWGTEFFKSPLPLVLELGCGKGEYTVALARTNPDHNYIGIDIKGARMHTGASIVNQEGIENAGFLRTEVELLDRFFAPGEVSEIWITFPDPQMKKTNKRLTSTRFISLYRKVMGPDGVVNLKTDSPFLYEYTRRMAQFNNLEILTDTADLYGSGLADETTAIKTFYECQWLSRGKKIKLLSFRLGSNPLAEPDISDLIEDDYRAVPRFNRSDYKEES